MSDRRAVGYSSQEMQSDATLKGNYHGSLKVAGYLYITEHFDEAFCS